MAGFLLIIDTRIGLVVPHQSNKNSHRTRTEVVRPVYHCMAKHPTTLIKPTLKKTLAYVSVLERPHTLDLFVFYDL